MNEPNYKFTIDLFCAKCGDRLAFEASDPVGTDSWGGVSLSVKACEKCEHLAATTTGASK